MYLKNPNCCTSLFTKNCTLLLTDYTLAMGARTEGTTIVKFYKIDRFYIEAYFNPRYKIFTKCVTFTEKEFIKRYLNKD